MIYCRGAGRYKHGVTTCDILHGGREVQTWGDNERGRKIQTWGDNESPCRLRMSMLADNLYYESPCRLRVSLLADNLYYESPCRLRVSLHADNLY